MRATATDSAEGDTASSTDRRGTDTFAEVIDACSLCDDVDAAGSIGIGNVSGVDAALGLDVTLDDFIDGVYSDLLPGELDPLSEALWESPTLPPPQPPTPLPPLPAPLPPTSLPETALPVNNDSTLLPICTAVPLPISLAIPITYPLPSTPIVQLPFAAPVATLTSSNPIGYATGGGVPPAAAYSMACLMVPAVEKRRRDPTEPENPTPDEKKARAEGQTPRPCVSCRTSKVLCDRTYPCLRCRRLHIPCQIPPTVRRGRPTQFERAQRKVSATAALLSMNDKEADNETATKDEETESSNASECRLDIGDQLPASPPSSPPEPLVDSPLEHPPNTVTTAGRVLGASGGTAKASSGAPHARQLLGAGLVGLLTLVAVDRLLLLTPVASAPRTPLGLLGRMNATAAFGTSSGLGAPAADHEAKDMLFGEAAKAAARAEAKAAKVAGMVERAEAATAAAAIAKVEAAEAAKEAAEAAAAAGAVSKTIGAEVEALLPTIHPWASVLMINSGFYWLFLACATVCPEGATPGSRLWVFLVAACVGANIGRLRFFLAVVQRPEHGDDQGSAASIMIRQVSSLRPTDPPPHPYAMSPNHTPRGELARECLRSEHHRPLHSS